MPFLKSRNHTYRPAWLDAQKNVVRDGFRIATYGSTPNEKYTGQFKRDLKHGKGVQKYGDGAMYVGDWAQGKRAGHGVFSYNCGNGIRSRLFIGQWDKDKPNGFGMKYYPDGGLYRGNFKHGLRHGWGCMKYPNGEIYIGKWFKDQKSGPGRLTDPKTGNYYEGSFKKDVKCGRGMYYHLQTGQLQDGIWLADELIVSEMFDDEERRPSAPQMTPFPIPTVQLAQPEEVYLEVANEVLDLVEKY